MAVTLLARIIVFGMVSICSTLHKFMPDVALFLKNLSMLCKESKKDCVVVPLDELRGRFILSVILLARFEDASPNRCSFR